MYSETVLEHFRNPRNVGRLEAASAAGTEGVPGAGNYMMVSVRVAESVVEAASFETYGCPGAIACGSYLTEWIRGMPVPEAGRITAEELAQRLGGLPLGKSHCAQLAVGALRRALSQL